MYENQTIEQSIIHELTEGVHFSVPGLDPNPLKRAGCFKEADLTAALLPVSVFERISLDRMDEVILQNRFDTKYFFHISRLLPILEKISSDYFILEINGTIIQLYETTYYDTPSDKFYLAHHNGKLNRIKIRKRCYLNSGVCFLEVKRKDNKGKMKKYRMQCLFPDQPFSADEKAFLRKYAPGNEEGLSIRMKNSFNRITLVNRNLQERVTIDFNLAFRDNHPAMKMNDLVVTELKHERFKATSCLGNIFKAEHIYEGSFSKYCIGRAMLHPVLKKNRFKPTLLHLERKFKLTRYE